MTTVTAASVSLYAEHLARLAKRKPWASETKLDKDTVLVSTPMGHSIVDLNAPKPTCYVYRYLDPRPGKNLVPIYVGKGTGPRLETHLQETRNPLFARILAKCAKVGLKPIIEIVQHFEDEASAFRLEIELIAKYGRRNLRTGTLCNLTNGGEGISGFKLSRRVEEAQQAEKRNQKAIWVAAKLYNPRARVRLIPRGKPYFTATTRAGRGGLSLGYRRLLGKPGTWTLRQADGNGSNWTARIGTANDYEKANGSDVLTYWQALEKAHEIVEERRNRTDDHRQDAANINS
jgi:hypothetical protein